MNLENKFAETILEQEIFRSDNQLNRYSSLFWINFNLLKVEFDMCENQSVESLMQFPCEKIMSFMFLINKIIIHG